MEKHHIFPVSIFRKNKIIVKLTAREHYIAHLLLWKYYKNKYGKEDKRTKKMFFAVKSMGFSKKQKINSRLHEIFRKEFASLCSKQKTGIPRTLKTKIKLRSSCSFRSRSIKRIDVKTKIIKEYEHLRDAVREGFNSGSIWRICNNMYGEKSHKGFYWEYLDG